ncbi:hypothetical protein [Bradyrhizobium acaciae]|nr:hypothetical protein [Bradyrhizobium acaciae]
MFSIVRILVLIACAHAGSAFAEMPSNGSRPLQAAHAQAVHVDV